MKNFLKLFSFFCIISFSFNCQPEMTGENEKTLTTEMRTSGCDCDTNGTIDPIIINVEDDCETQEEECCFDIRFSFAYVAPSMQTPETNYLSPDVGAIQNFTVDPLTGLAHFCIKCEVTCFKIIVYNYSSMPPQYDCYEFESPCL